jgi:hypothetical protein
MKILKIIGWTVLGLIILIQFIPVSYPDKAEVNRNDLFQTGSIPEEVESILRTSCYDCHSNETHYPWYSYIAPVKWLVVRDVDEGRSELNFSEWNNLDIRDKIKLLDGIAEEVEDGKMPMPIYTLVHRSASLNEERKQVVIDWTEQMMLDILGE